MEEGFFKCQKKENRTSSCATLSSFCLTLDACSPGRDERVIYTAVNNVKEAGFGVHCAVWVLVIESSVPEGSTEGWGPW